METRNGVKSKSFQYESTRNPSPSATTCETSGGKLASLANTPTPLATLAAPPPRSLACHTQPQQVGFEVVASTSLGGRFDLKWGP